MKRLSVTTILCMALTVLVLATSIPPAAPLKERVKNADHIFTGVATEMSLVNANGKVITNNVDSTSLELGLRVTVIPKQVFRTPLKKFPNKVIFTYGQGFNLSVKAEKERLFHKEMYYLLSGKTFAPVHALEFCEPIGKKKEIDEYLKEKPVE